MQKDDERLRQFQKNLKKLLDRHDGNVSRAARAVNMHPNTLKTWVESATIPSGLDSVLRIADYIGLTVGQFFGEEDSNLLKGNGSEASLEGRYEIVVKRSKSE